MPSPRVPLWLASLALVAFSGCGYVHFGRINKDSPASALGDTQLLNDNANLRLEKKMLQQELALTRAQGEALRTAIENRTSDGDTSRRLTDKLTQTTRELSALRADYLKLQTERANLALVRPEDTTELRTKLGATEEKLAGYLRSVTQLNGEIASLKADLDRTRAENSVLTEKVKVVTAKNEEAQAALAALNSELLSAEGIPHPRHPGCRHAADAIGFRQREALRACPAADAAGRRRAGPRGPGHRRFERR
jgi:uncharacterized coiled-coil protein SlyX